ncbi:MAG: hypothetical protein LKJ25_11645 [Clostridia bacterium]|nr:hypothetical protein [Clostridia bacterium]
MLTNPNKSCSHEGLSAMNSEQSWPPCPPYPPYPPCPRGPAGPQGPSGPRGLPGSLNNTAISFAYAQLAHVIEQLMEYYPDETITVFLSSFTPYQTSGKSHEFYKSEEGTFGGVFVLDNNGLYISVPLNAIVGLQFESSGIAYNPAINFLSKPDFPPGYDTNIITAMHDYFATITGSIELHSGSRIYGIGPIYKNPYGLVVQANADGTDPSFTPVLTITAFAQLETATSKGNSDNNVSRVRLSVENNDK